MENGLEISSKKFEAIGKIHLVEFIESDEKLLLIGSDSHDKKILKVVIWDLYNTNEVETLQLENLNFTTQNISTRLASTSGNLLQVDDEGKVTSILKMIELMKGKEDKMNEKNLVEYPPKLGGPSIPLIKNELKKHNIFFYEIYNENKFRPVVKETEPWVKDIYEKNSFYLCNSETEALQLIVGRSTIQIWHQIHKWKKNLPNKGKPFLEFIWTNGIPVKQENKENKLRIKEIKFGHEYFHLEIYWYEVEPKKEMNKHEMIDKMENMKDIDGMIKKERTIEWGDINENVNGVRYACKALEHLNKRAKFLTNYSKTQKVS